MISIITPVYNRADLTKDYLESLRLNRGEVTEIIIINNNSSDETSNLLNKYKTEFSAIGISFKIIVNYENKSFAVACNQGAEAANGKYLLFLNNDMLILPDFIDNLKATFEDDECGIAGAKLLYQDLTIQHAGVVFNKGNSVEHLYKNLDYTFPESCQKQEYQAVTGAALMINKDLFNKVQGFSEGYYNCFEDIDLCFKIKEAGYKIIYNPDAIALHLESKTPGRKDAEKERKSGQLFMQKWQGKILNDEIKTNLSFKIYEEFKDKESRLVNLGLLLERANEFYNQQNFFATIHYYKLLFRINPLHFTREAYENVVYACLKINQYSMAEFFLKRSDELAGGLTRFSYETSSLKLCRVKEIFNLPAQKKKTQKDLISIIIPVLNNLNYTKDCLESVFKHSDTAYEIIVINNNSTDGTFEYLEELKTSYKEQTAYCRNFKVIYNQENKPFGVSNNQGAKIADGEYLLLLNNDTKVTKSWLSIFLNTIREDISIGAVGAKLLYADDTIQHAGVVFQKPRVIPFHFLQGADKEHPAVNQKREFNAVTAACILIRADVFKFCNGFNEAYLNCWEDIDLCLKIKLSGYKIIYDPKVIVYHFESKTPGRKDNESYGAAILYSSWNQIYQKFVTAEEEYQKLGLELSYSEQNHSIIYDFTDVKLKERLQKCAELFQKKYYPDFLQLIEPVRFLVPKALNKELYQQIIKAYEVMGNPEMVEKITKRYIKILGKKNGSA